jgi:hypothetical protein
MKQRYIVMEIKEDYDFRDLKNKCWSGAKDTLDMISDNGYENELMSHLEDVFYGDIPTLTEVNDYLWFEEDAIKEALGIFKLDEKVNMKVLKELRSAVNGAIKIKDVPDDIIYTFGQLSDNLDELADCEDESEFDDIKNDIEDLNNTLVDLLDDNEDVGDAFKKDIQKNIVNIIERDLFN